MEKRFRLLKAIFLMSIAIHGSYLSFAQEKQYVKSPEAILNINVFTEESFQTIEHFGASDAWSTQFVGLWPDQKKNAMAELLFSSENDATGNPKGIGLSMWRFNVGAGSAEQGEESGIPDEWRRAESFLNSDGSYDWSKQAGQVWFAKAAQEFGVDNLLIFPNSPPIYMTRTEKAYAIRGESNLAADNYDDFAEYLVQVIKGLEDKGLHVGYVSPVNEPQWDWSDSGQEGTPFWNNEIAGIVKSLNSVLEKSDLTTKIDIAEAGKINYLYEQADKAGRGGQVVDFFHPASPNYIGDLKSLSRSISGHSYFTTSPNEFAVAQRETLYASIKAVEGLNYWMSEYCILGDNAGEINGNGRDLGIDPALYMARVIHNDLTVSNASAWHWWLAISPYDYKDGLIYIDKEKEDGTFYESKMLWALGNYSRFIQPGYQRIAVEITNRKENFPEILVSAYQAPDTGEIVLVLVNSEINELTISLSVDDIHKSMKQIYVTSEDMNLEIIKSEGAPGNIQLPARSIVTIITDK